jgi:UDP-N-acetylglucosamine acyltransferase
MNLIESSAKIIGDVTMGDGNYIGHNAVLIGPLSMGDDNYIGSMAVIGTSAQDDILTSRDHWPDIKQDISIRIGSGNVIREFSTIHRGIISETTIGSGCYLMAYSGINHDSRIGDSVKFANTVQIGGFTTVQDYAYLGLSSVIHQFTVIGQASMVGMNSTVTKSTRPGSTIVGTPARFLKPNLIGLQRLGIVDDSWWHDPERFPDNYREAFSKFDDEVSRRTAEAIMVRELRSNLLKGKLRD